MKKIDISPISTTNGFPFKSGTLAHLQSAYQEAIAESVKVLIGASYDPSKVYRLSGCVNTGAGSNYIISAGAVFYNGEVYLVDAANFAVSGSQTAVGLITTSYFADPTADPVEFTDGTPRNVHEVRKIVLQAGLSGAGTGDFSDWINPQVNVSGNGVSGTYPNFTISNDILRKISIQLGDVNTAPADPNTNLLAGGSTTLAAYVHNFAAPLEDANYLVFASVRNDSYDTTAEFANNFGVSVLIGRRLANQIYFAIWVEPSAGGNTQNITVDLMLIPSV